MIDFMRRIDPRVFFGVMHALILTFMFFMPELAAAAGNNNSGSGSGTGRFTFNDNTFQPPTGLKGAFAKGGAEWWDTIATGGVWISVAAAAILYVTGLTQYLRWAALAAIIFAFGDDILLGAARIGGVTV